MKTLLPLNHTTFNDIAQVPIFFSYFFLFPLPLISFFFHKLSSPRSTWHRDTKSAHMWRVEPRLPAIFSTKKLKQDVHSRRNRNSSESRLGGSLLHAPISVAAANRLLGGCTTCYYVFSSRKGVSYATLVLHWRNSQPSYV